MEVAMYVPPTLLERLLARLGAVKEHLKRARKCWRGKSAPRRRKKRKAVASKAGKVLARKRWSAAKKAELAKQAKLAERRAKRAAAAENSNVVPFKRRVA
jgi:hypothetical protein